MGSLVPATELISSQEYYMEILIGFDAAKTTAGDWGRLVSFFICAISCYIFTTQQQIMQGIKEWLC